MLATFRRKYALPAIAMVLPLLLAKAVIFTIKQFAENWYVATLTWLYGRYGLDYVATAMAWYSATPAVSIIAGCALVVVLLWAISFADDRLLARQTASGTITGPASLPKITLHVVIDTRFAPPMWDKHHFGRGRYASRGSAFLLLTNRLTGPVVPIRAQVRLRGLDRFRRKVHDVSFTGPAARLGEAVPGEATQGGWALSFFLLPELKPGSVFRADIVVYDFYNNAHVVKDVRFTAGFPDALPRALMQRGGEAE